jgi:hypothetical protein
MYVGTIYWLSKNNFRLRKKLQLVELIGGLIQSREVADEATRGIS